MSVEKRGSSWRARLRTADGRQIQKSFPDKPAAERWERAQRSAIDQGSWIDPQLGAMTFAAYCEEWLRHLAAGRRASTIAQVESRLRHHVLPVLGPIPLARIRRSQCQEVLTRAASHLAPGTTRVVKVAMCAVLQSAVDDRLIPTSPATRLTLPTVESTVDVLSAEQVVAIVERFEPSLRAMVVVVAGTGLRSGEARALRVDKLTPRLHLAGEVVPSQCALAIDAQVTNQRTLGPVKTSSSVRTVTVSASVVAALREHLATFGAGDGGLLFRAADGGPLSGSMVADAWGRATAGMGLPPRSGLHVLRHTHASQLLSQGISPAAIARRLGHSHAGITLSTYSHIVAGDEQRLLDAAEANAARWA